jgi:hypothetical protein
LAVAIERAGRAPANRDGIARADPADGHGEPALGCATYPRELLKLGFSVAQSTVAKYMVKRRGAPSRRRRTFLRNHAPDIAVMDLFVAPTMALAEWIAWQITEAFPWDGAPCYMIGDRDRIYGAVVTRRLRAMGIRDKPIAPISPWQNGFAERLIGSISLPPERVLSWRPRRAAPCRRVPRGPRRS